MKQNLQIRFVLFLLFSFFNLNVFNSWSTVSIIPTDSSQTDIFNTYKFALYSAYVDNRTTGANLDSILFPKYGEFSVYLAKTGNNKGCFIYPDAMPSAYSTVSNSQLNSYDWQAEEHYSIQFKLNTKNIAIFKSKILMNNKTVSWESIYFKNLFDTYFYNNMYYYTNEDDIDTNGINTSAQLLIIPSFTPNGTDNKLYIDSVFAITPNLKSQLDAFLTRGGVIYAEGNSAYFIEKLGYLQKNSVNFANSMLPDPKTGLIKINYSNSKNPITLTQNSVGNYLYADVIPTVNAPSAEVIASLQNNGTPVSFVLSGQNANGGMIICNTGLPTIGGLNYIQKGSTNAESRQIVWSLNAILTAFAKNIDMTRSIYNDLPNEITAGKNAIAYDAIDTFEVRIKLRNLSETPIYDIQIQEYIRDYFQFTDLQEPGVNYTINGNTLTISNISLQPMTERVITYRLQTPDPTNPIHDKVDSYISFANSIYASYGVVSYIDETGNNMFVKYRDYTDLMFSAKLAADADLNWKNFLGLYYQPFKVFMIMENKERTPAMETQYVQYIPKDVPFYWTDNTLNIPILKTPGGKFVDILKGSDNEGTPEFDMDGDGHPDVWLDTASIYPKGYTIEEDSVYWLNPWEHFRSGDTTYYEDINHDGIRAQDLNGDGIVDVDAPGDKIRVWKVIWNIGKVNGHDYFDPYCYYEIWVDPPDLVPMSAGVGYAKGLCDSIAGMFYPYAKDINAANLNDKHWENWMEKDPDGNVIWKQLIWQKIHNYEGFTFIDTLKENYKLKPTDKCSGTVPQPHREFIAVLSLGGEEIDMTHPTPSKSLYSNLTYKTIFNETRTTPIRTTYTYYAPLPNPLQFEYLTNNFQITDNSGQPMKYLPKNGTANLTFDVDASTEYSYYWIRGAGHDVDYNDPSLAMEGIDKLGDGVFGYMIYDIPKGLGGYKITLPKKANGTYDTDAILEVDGHKFEKWLDNPHTGDNVEIWEDQFQYHVYIPQLLIPPALDDDNHDGIDDWIDDRGDRFHSSSGYLHDEFMLGNGEDYPAGSPNVFPHDDDIYGHVDSGWSAGADGTYGDDFFEDLGKVHFKIHAIYNGQGKEGPVDISLGGWLVVEEIFGGSPWVIFSHVLSGFAQGTDYRLASYSNPSVVKFGTDTTYIKHYIYDNNEPHDFNADFDPYHVSFGYGESTVSTIVGGKDPCSLIEPAINTTSIIDPVKNQYKVTLIPNTDGTNPDLKDYPKQVQGSFVEIKIEAMNGTDDNWENTTITPILPPELLNSKVIMNYVAYPRPLVPAMVDPVSGKITHTGDQLGSFTTGWRFNQPEGEVLVKMGNTLNLLQPSRRAYFIYLVSIDPTLPKGVYNIDFAMSGNRIHYDGTDKGFLNWDVPSAMFSITGRDNSGNITAYQKVVVGTGSLKNITVKETNNFKGLQNVKWSNKDITYANFDTLKSTLPASYNSQTGTETIDLSSFSTFPTVQNPYLYILEQGESNSYNADDYFDIATNSKLNFTNSNNTNANLATGRLTVNSTGPKVKAYKRITKINGAPVPEKAIFKFQPNVDKDFEMLIEASNSGNDIAENTILGINPGPFFIPDTSRLPVNTVCMNNVVIANPGALVPGETKRILLHYKSAPASCAVVYDTSTIVNSIDIRYNGKSPKGNITSKALFVCEDNAILDGPAFDFGITDLSSSLPELIHGKTTNLTATIKNGVLPANNVTARIYAVQDNIDTVLVYEEVIPTIKKLETIQLSSNYIIPDSVNYVEFFSNIDVEDSFNEFCTNNNIKILQVPMKGPNWILNVTNNPNPFEFTTQFNYTLPREVNSVSLSIYSLDGQLMKTFDNCPTALGRHAIWWNGSDFPKGIYIIKYNGINSGGGRETFTGKFSKN